MFQSVHLRPKVLCSYVLISIEQTKQRSQCNKKRGLAHVHIKY
jgi:hypothetical protein